MQLDGSSVLTSVSDATDIRVGDRVRVSIENHVATVTENLSTPASGYSASETEAAVYEYLKADYLDVVDARIGNLTANYITVGYLTANYITATDISAKYVTTDTLTANYITATDISAKYVTTDTLTANYVKTSYLTANYITATDIAAKYVTTNTLTANYITASDIKATYATIDLANVSVESVGTLFAGVGLLTSMTVVDGYITGALNGVTISASQLTAGTIDAGTIDVVNLNCANLTVGTINGSQIASGTITAENLSEDITSAIATAQQTADGKNAVYYSATAPSGGTYSANDIWYDTANGYAMYYWNGSEWVKAVYGASALSEEVTADITAALEEAGLAKEAIDNISVGARNLILASEEISATRTNATNNWLAEINPFAYNSDYGVAKIREGGEFTLSFEYVISGITTACNVYLALRNAESGYTRGNAASIALAVGDNSGHYSCTFAPTEGQMEFGTRWLLTGFGAGNNAGTEISLTHIKLETGNTETDWVPAPEDTETAIDEVITIVNGKTTSYYADTVPSGTNYATGDIWFDTADDNAMYYWNGSEWVKAVYGASALSDEVTADIAEALEKAGLATEAVNNLSVGGRNYLTGTRDFDSGTWTKSSNVTLAADNEDYTVVTWAATSTLGWNAINTTNAPIQFSLVRGQSVVLSFDVRSDDYEALNALTNRGLAVTFNLCTSDSASRTLYRYCSLYAIELTDDWQRITVAATLTDDYFTSGSGEIDDDTRLYIGIYDYSLYSMQVRKAKLEIGNVATDWSPAPEDAETAIDEVITIVNGKTTSYYADTAPSGTNYTTGDIWFDTANDNAMYYWNGSEWTLAPLGTGAIADGAITADLIAASAVTAGKISSGAVTTDKLAANAVTAAKIAASTITSAQIAAGTITGDNIAASAITAGKISSGAVTTDKLAANAVTAAKIAASTITSTQIAAGTITGDNIATSTITAGNLVAGTITSNEIASGTITASNIASGTITAKLIATGTITGDLVAAKTITGDNLVANTITATQIAASTITANEIDVANLTASTAFLTSLVAQDAFINAISTNSVVVGNSDAVKKAIVRQTTYYTTTDSATTAPEDDAIWSTDIPERTSGVYVWYKVVSTTFGGETSESNPVCISGLDGADGTDGSSFTWNLLPGSRSMSDWVKSSNVTLDEDDEGYTVATWAATTTVGWNAVQSRDPIPFSLVRGQMVTLSFDIRSDDFDSSDTSTTNRIVAGFCLCTADNTTRTLYQTAAVTRTSIAADWVRYTLTVTLTDEYFTLGSGTIDDDTRFYIAIFDYSLYSIQVRKIKLEIGSNASAWTPAESEIYGADGAAGADGVGFSSVTEHYAVSSSSSTAPTTWYTTLQTMTTTNKYLWNYETITCTDGSTIDTTKRVIGVHGNTGATGAAGADGQDGVDGTDGVGISSIKNYYLRSTASSGVTTSTSGWTTTIQTITTTYKYLWNYEVVTYTDGSTYTSTPCIIGVYGNTGATGATGADGKDGADGADGKDGADGADGQMLYATCSTAASTKAKVALLAVGNLTLSAGATVAVTFTYANTAASATLNISGTGAATIHVYGSALTSSSPYNWVAGATVQFVYDGTYWNMTDTSALYAIGNWCYDNNLAYIDGGNLYAGTVAAAQIAAGAVTAEKISVDELSAITGNVGTLTSGILKSSNYDAGTGAGLLIDLDNGTITGSDLTLLATQLNNISVGGRNYIIQSTMTAGYRLNNAGTGYASSYSSITAYIAVPTSASEMTFSVHTVYTNEGDCYFQVAFYDSSKTFISRALHQTANTTDAKTSWTMEVPAGAVYFRAALPTSIKDKVKFEAGNMATDWTPAPEDTEDQVEAKLALTVDDEGVAKLSGNADRIELTAGQLVVTSDNFTLTEDGTIAANEGTIGPLTITNSANTDAYTGHYTTTSVMLQNLGVNIAVNDVAGTGVTKTLVDMEWGLKNCGTTLDNAVMYLCVKNPDDDWSTKTAPRLFYVTGNGQMRCCGLELYPNLALDYNEGAIELPDDDIMCAWTDDYALVLHSVEFTDQAVDSDVDPSCENTYDLGGSLFYWRRVYCDTIYRNSTASTSSDRKLKQNITTLGDKYDDFIMGLTPVSFEYKDGDSHRKHLGFIAQDVRDLAMDTVGDLALFKAQVIGDDRATYQEGKYTDDQLKWGLSYEEFVPLAIKMLQDDRKRIERLEAALEAIETTQTQ